MLLFGLVLLLALITGALVVLFTELTIELFAVLFALFKFWFMLLGLFE